MPNWVNVDIVINGEKEVLDRLHEKVWVDGNFDFNGITPMPKSLLDAESGGHTTESIVYVLTDKLSKKLEDLDNNSLELLSKYVKSSVFFSDDMYTNSYKRVLEWIDKKEPYDGFWENLYNMGKRYIHNLENYGHTDWYSWSIENWGTKWNSSSCHYYYNSDSEIVYSFSTAWSYPAPVLNKLAEMFPEVDISMQFIEEQAYNGSFWLDEMMIKAYENPDKELIFQSGYFGTCDKLPFDYREDKPISARTLLNGIPMISSLIEEYGSDLDFDIKRSKNDLDLLYKEPELDLRRIKETKDNFNQLVFEEKRVTKALSLIEKIS